MRKKQKEILAELCDCVEITIIEGTMKEENVHLYFSVLPKHSLSRVIEILNGKNAEYLRKEFPELSKKYWGMHIWVRGYRVSTVVINGETIKNYIKKHQEEEIQEEHGDYGKTTAGDIVRSCCL